MKYLKIILLTPLCIWLLTGLSYVILGCESKAWVAISCYCFGVNVGPALNNLLNISFFGVVISFFIAVPALILGWMFGMENTEKKSDEESIEQ